MSEFKSGWWVYRSHTYKIDRQWRPSEREGDFQKVYNSVHCFPLETLLLALNVTVIDFLSLDTEGGEWQMLKLFPWGRIALRVLAVEYITENRLTRLSMPFIHFMETKGFFLVETSKSHDYIFVNKSDRLIQKLKRF